MLLIVDCLHLENAQDLKAGARGEKFKSKKYKSNPTFIAFTGKMVLYLIRLVLGIFMWNFISLLVFIHFVSQFTFMSRVGIVL